MQAVTSVILEEERVNEYLAEHKLEEGSVPIVAALLQRWGTAEGNPCVMLVIEVDGKKVIAKTTLNMLLTLASGLKAGAEARGWVRPL